MYLEQFLNFTINENILHRIKCEERGNYRLPLQHSIDSNALKQAAKITTI